MPSASLTTPPESAYSLVETQVDSFEIELAKAAADYYADPLGFVLCMFPWGHGSLANYAGPDQWQTEFLDDLGKQVRARGFDGHTPVLPIRFSTASGAWNRESTLVAWIVLWLMSTRPHCKGTITSNTFLQLTTRTWSAIQTWTKRCLTGHWFMVTTERIYHRQFKESCFVRRNRAAKKTARRSRDNMLLTAHRFTFSTKLARFQTQFSRLQRAD